MYDSNAYNANLAHWVYCAKSRKERKIAKVTFFLKTLGDYLKEKGLAQFSSHTSDYVHAFYTLTKDPKTRIHIKAAPRWTNKTRVTARLINDAIAMALRDTGTAIGHEEQAVIKEFPNLQNAEVSIGTPQAVIRLEEKLRENIPDLL